MSDTHDGGPAFPRPGQEVNFGDGWLPAYDGMSLRDWFAGRALAGLLSHETWEASDADLFARDAYTLADAMLRAREAGR